MLPISTPSNASMANGRAVHPGTRRKSQRLARINDYLQQALADPDALAANVGAVTTDLMRVEYHLMRAIDKALVRSANPLDEFQTLRPAIDTCAQLTRQM